jgi:hypothetical protein
MNLFQFYIIDEILKLKVTELTDPHDPARDAFLRGNEEDDDDSDDEDGFQATSPTQRKRNEQYDTMHDNTTDLEQGLGVGGDGNGNEEVIESKNRSKSNMTIKVGIQERSDDQRDADELDGGRTPTMTYPPLTSVSPNSTTQHRPTFSTYSTSDTMAPFPTRKNEVSLYRGRNSSVDGSEKNSDGWGLSTDSIESFKATS